MQEHRETQKEKKVMSPAKVSCAIWLQKAETFPTSASLCPTSTDSEGLRGFLGVMEKKAWRAGGFTAGNQKLGFLQQLFKMLLFLLFK